MKPPTERVLCFPAWQLEHLVVFQGLSMDPKYLKLITAFHLHQFIDREDAETNPEWKQIIPYVLVVHNGSILTYARGKSGGEDRLHAKLSVGVGGHISDGDGDYWNGLRREVHEELSVDPNMSEPIAFLNDVSTPVGRAHFGVVHIGVLPIGRHKIEAEECIESAHFLSFKHAASLDNLESWSRYCMDSPELLKMLEKAAT